MKKLLFFGAGPWAQNLLRNFQDHPEIQIGAVYSFRPQQQKPSPCLEWVFEQGIPVIQDWQDWINRNGLPDGVAMATRPDRQVELGSSFLEKGVPVLFEKPLALNSADASSLLTLSKEYQVPCLVDHVYLYNPVFSTLRNYIRSNKLQLQSIETLRGGPGPWRSYMNGLWDWAPHDLSMILAIAGQMPEKFQVNKVERQRFQAEQDGLVVDFSMEFSCMDGQDSVPWLVNGQIGNGMQCRERKMHLHFHNGGSILFDDDADQKLVFSDSGRPLPQENETVSPLRCLTEAFYNCMSDRTLPTHDLQIGTQVVTLIERMEAKLSTA